MRQIERVAVIGSGAWGSALALVLANNGLDVRLCSRSPERARLISTSRISSQLKDHPLPEAVSVVADVSSAVRGAELVVLAIPSAAFRQTVRQLQSAPLNDVCLLSATKGIENDSLALMSQVIEQELGAAFSDSIAVLSGPSFAVEVARGLPTNIVCASSNLELAVHLQHAVSTDTFRVYTSSDVVGVQVGGALKNVIAIASGASDALGFGNNTRAALITRGLAEVARLCRAMGGDPRTVAGLSGLGDLVLTCSGELSRNRTVGFQMGRGTGLDSALAALGHVAEGVPTARSVHRLASQLGVDLPICGAVHEVLFGGKSPKQAVRDLLARRLKQEWE